VTILLVLLLVFSMTWWISSSISNTFRDLMDNLSIGAMGDYSKRLSVRGSGEIGRLTEYYNTFMERLEVSNGELKRHRDQLENLVAERTEALTVTNRSLEKEIIEHNRAEEELVKKAGLQEEIFTNTPSAVFVKDIYGRYILVNKQAERMMGVSQNEVVNRSMDQVAPKKSVEAFIEEDRQIVETRESFKKTITREIEGKTRTFSVTKFPLIDAKGEVYAIGGVASDITDLLEARQRAEAANTAKSEFLANMSHEIRTPLNAILGFTEILESQIGDPRHRQYLTSVSSSGQSLLELINDILDLSKVEAGKLELEYSAFDPRTVFEEMRRIFSKKLTDKGLEFLLEIGPDLPQAIVLDETRFRQILLNLLGNAIKFTNDGYVKLGARLHVAGQDFAHPELEVFVEDTGVGISEDQRDMIFGAFEQQAGQSSAQFGGTGLGLTISRRLAEMMGGTIVLTSETGKGSRFSVIFEDMETAATADQKEKEDRGDPELVGFEKARILIADDIKLNRRLLADFLKNYDLEIVEAENGREAVDKAVEYKPDLILMDMKMPVLDGKEATRQIKADSETSRIPVIAVTASVMKEEQERIGRICDALLVKPVSKSDLVFEMAGFLNHSLAESAAARHDIAPSVATEGGPSERSKTDPSERPGQEVLSGLSDLMDILTKERDDVWEGLRETLTVNDIEAFAQRLIELDDAFHYRPLKTWADDLLQQAVMFDVEALPVTLNRFPDLIREISALIGD
ncbi:MAG: response regulator, partial [Proteobacteria bacterium]|nr:response regulator [Pseudomonadota bacterium]